MMDRPGEIHLHIEEVVLYGYSARERSTLAHDLETRLQELFIGHPSSWRRPRRVDRVGPIEMDAGDSVTTTMGSSLADSLFDALRGAAAKGGVSGG
jgi:hypothetical protein